MRKPRLSRRTSAENEMAVFEYRELAIFILEILDAMLRNCCGK